MKTYIIQSRTDAAIKKLEIFEAENWAKALSIFSEWIEGDIRKETQLIEDTKRARTIEFVWWMNKWGDIPAEATNRTPAWYWGPGFYTKGNQPELVKLMGAVPETGIFRDLILIEL